MNPKRGVWIKSTFIIGVTMALGLLSSRSFAAACLIKPRHVDGPISIVYTLMLAPEREAAVYESLGFQRVRCPTDRTLLRIYVERLCGNKGPRGAPAVKVDALFGRSQALVCKSARAGLLEAGG